MLNLVFLINCIEGMTAEAFVDHHRNAQAPLFASIPEAKRYIRRYTISHPVAAPAYPAPAYDGLTEISFDNWSDHDAFFSSANFLDKVQPDEANFFEAASVGVMVTEERVIMK